MTLWKTAAPFVPLLALVLACAPSFAANEWLKAQASAAADGLAPATAAEDEPGALIEQAVAASRKGDLTLAISLATRAIVAAPEQPQARQLRAQLYEKQGHYPKAIADYGEIVKRDPKAADAWQRRGEAWFKSGKFAESVSDFDRYLTLAPDQKPYHWQRGISLYYAGRFAAGRQQFELHQTVNPHDVENAVWHFLCTARADGLAAAKRRLIPIENDARVPMAQVHQLFAGKCSPADVLAAAESVPNDARAGEPLFYAHLYLGLYYEAIGDPKQARDHIFKAAERSRENGYMGDVARVHAEVLRKRERGKRPVT
jgi:lipoprotein NlpI